jgi:hypothetical protein
MRRVAFVIALLAAALACGTPTAPAPVGPPRGAAPVAPVEPAASTLTVPLTIPLADLAASIDRELPATLVTERGKVLQGPLRLDLDVTRTGPPRLAPHGRDTLRATVPLKVEAKVYAEGLPRGRGGGAPVTAALEVLLDLTPSLGPDGGLRAATSLNYRWTSPPTIQVGPATIPLQQLVDPKLRDTLPDIARRIAEDIEAKDKTRDAVKQAWTRIAGTHTAPTDPPAWVRIVPTALGASPIRVTADALQLTLAVTAVVTSGLGPAPTTPPPAQPPIGAARDAPASLRLPVEVALPWDALSRAASEGLSAAPHAAPGIDGVTVDVRAVELYPSGDRVAAGVDLAATTPAGALEGRLWLLARPRLDTDARVVALEDVDFAVAAGTIDAFANHPTVRQAALDRVRQHLVVPFGPALDEARAKAQARLDVLPAPPGLTLDADLDGLAVTGVGLTDAALVVTARADGRLAITVHPPPAPPGR